MRLNQLVQQTSKLLDIELLYLPAYSPNPKLIERMWKFVKPKCLYSKYYPDFGAFTKRILRCLQKPNDEDKRELAALLTLNFQSFSKSHFVAV